MQSFSNVLPQLGAELNRHFMGEATALHIAWGDWGLSKYKDVCRLHANTMCNVHKKSEEFENCCCHNMFL
jgi:hypothetical protein